MTEPHRTAPPKRGRPRATGDRICGRCGRAVGYLRSVGWPEGPICGICYETATHTRGRCPSCGEDRLLPGLDAERRPICVTCAGLPSDFHCTRCGREQE